MSPLGSLIPTILIPTILIPTILMVATPSTPPPPPTPHELVARLLDDAQFEAAQKQIAAFGPGIVPALLDAVRDPEFRWPPERVPKDVTARMLKRTMPLDSVLRCLADYPSEDAVPLVIPLIDDEEPLLRRGAAAVLGSSGATAAIEPLRRSLRDPESWIRDAAVRGIADAVDGRRATDAFRAAMFDEMLPMLDDRVSWTRVSAADVMMEIDRKRALPVLTDPKRLVAENPRVSVVLKTLDAYRVVVDEQVLLTLLSALEQRPTPRPPTNAIRCTHRLLARIESDAALAAITRGLDAPHRGIREGASIALALRHGVEWPHLPALDRYRDEGWDALPQPLRVMVSVHLFDYYVSHGGFERFLDEEENEQYGTEDVISALRTIGADADVELLREAMKHRDDEERLAELDDRYEDDRDDRWVKRNLYAAEHADHFRNRK